MLWTELYIERVGTLGRVGRWIGITLVLVIGGGSTLLALAIAGSRWIIPNAVLQLQATDLLGLLVNGSGEILSWLIPWAVGLRAAVSISSERERDTWDSLLTSPLTGREIVTGKVWGSLHAIVWLMGAAVLAWTWALVWGATSAGEYGAWLSRLIIQGLFLAALGVRASLVGRTATGTLTITVGSWLAMLIVVPVVSFIAWCAVQLALLSITAAVWGWSGPPVALFRTVSDWVFFLTWYALYVLAAVACIGDTSLRFDRLAGRMVEGGAALSVDRVLHGRPLAPVFLPTRSKLKEPVSDAK
jgi:ABC-type transport system involved in multi-copper enzyme maturation permease subunit